MFKNRELLQMALLLLCVSIAALSSQSIVAAPAYGIVDLGTLGGTYAYGIGVNASGVVSGYSFTSGDPSLSNDFRAILYDGVLHDLGTLGGLTSNGYDINSSGQVTGYSNPPADGNYRAFLWSPVTANAAIGVMHDLGTLGGPSSTGYGINDQGQITGNSDTVEGPSHAFVWTPIAPGETSGTMHDLFPFVEESSRGIDINIHGQITGDFNGQAFLWTPTTPNGETGAAQLLGMLDGDNYSYGNSINANSQVAGTSGTTADETSHAFLYDGTMHDLGTLGGSISQGFGINSIGQVTGGSHIAESEDYHAFLYSHESGMVDLNTLIDPRLGWELSFATGINDAGQITGFGKIHGEQRAFLLTPASEPGSLALITLGAVVAALGTRRTTRS